MRCLHWSHNSGGICVGRSDNACWLCDISKCAAATAAAAHSEEGCLESLKLQSLVVTRVFFLFLLWIRVCSRDCRGRKEGRKEKVKGVEGSPLTFCTNFTPLSRCYRGRRTDGRTTRRLPPPQTSYREKKLPAARRPITRLGPPRQTVVRGDNGGNPGHDMTRRIPQ